MCEIENCIRKVKTRGYCHSHYESRRKAGKITKLSNSERFWSKVNKSENDGCWIWTGSKYKDGYGRFGYNKTRPMAHIMAWYLIHGVWPTLLLCHKCDNHSCVNPNHLFEGTHADNSADMVCKSRQANGEKIHTSKLTKEKVITIKQRLAEGTPRKILAQEYKVSCTCITAIANGKTWKHVNYEQPK